MEVTTRFPTVSFYQNYKLTRYGNLRKYSNIIDIMIIFKNLLRC